MSTKIYLGQLFHFSEINAVESHDTSVSGVVRIGARVPDVEELLGTLVDSAVKDPEAETATVLGLLRGLLSKQSAGATDLATLAGKDYATQTTLAAVLAKIIAAPATESKQDVGNKSLANLDITLSTLRSAITGATPKTLADVVAALGSMTFAAGTNIIGKMGIDQTTPGITNGVVVKNSSGAELMSETNPGVVKIGSAGIVIPIDKQGIYRSNVIDYTTALAASGAYTSSAIDGLTLKRLTGTVYADQAGTLYIQHSKDATTYRAITTITVAAGTAQGFDVPFYSRYIRLYYLNGSTAQSVFELVAYSSAD